MFTLVVTKILPYKKTHYFFVLGVLLLAVITPSCKQKTNKEKPSVEKQVSKPLSSSFTLPGYGLGSGKLP